MSPVIVKLNCPATGGFGEVVILLIVGVFAAAFTTNGHVPDGVPDEPLRTCTVK